MPALKLDRSIAGAVRVRSWSYEGAAARWPVGVHEGLEVALPTAGHLTYVIGSRTIEVAAGQAVIVPAEVEHQTGVSARLEAISLWIAGVCRPRRSSTTRGHENGLQGGGEGRG